MLRLAMLAAVLMAPLAAAANTTLPPPLTDNSTVTLEQLRTHSAKVFEAISGQGGGPISRDEFMALELPDGVGPRGDTDGMLARVFERLDKDGDGEISRTEWQTQINRDLEFADENNDGKVSLEELSNARENLGVGDVIGMMF